METTLRYLSRVWSSFMLCLIQVMDDNSTRIDALSTVEAPDLILSSQRVSMWVKDIETCT